MDSSADPRPETRRLSTPSLGITPIIIDRIEELPSGYLSTPSLGITDADRR
jgi:hypothetical protein